MKTLIIGYGHLGKIYAGALLSQKTTVPENLYILCKTAEQAQTVIQNRHGCPLVQPAEAGIKPEIMLLSVKPQDAASIYGTARFHLAPGTLVISVMAGIGIDTLRQQLRHDSVVRAMPNAAISVGLGMTGYTMPGWLDEKLKEKAGRFFAGTGKSLHFADEELLNAVTALSGSGPAYFFYVLQNMIRAGTAMGFSESEATTLVKQTMLGAVQLFDRSGQTAETLMAQVASKGGTTEAAFAVFGQNNMGETLVKGIHRAHERAGELSRLHTGAALNNAAADD